MIAEKVFKENITAKLAFKKAKSTGTRGFVPEAPPVKEVQEISEKKFENKNLNYQTESN